MSDLSAPSTALRRSYECARGLELGAQVRECVDQLGHPELMAREVLEAFLAIEDWCEETELPKPEEIAEPLLPDDDGDAIFYPTREIAVLREPCAFTCLATGVDPLGDLRSSVGEAPDGLDFVGLTCDPSHTPVLGTVESRADASAYPLLLRGLSCLAEMAPVAQIQRLNESFFLGMLAPRPSFDLYLVLQDHWDRDDKTALEQLTRDLAEKLKGTIRDHTSFPQILRNIICLRMNPGRFDSRLRFEWRV